MKIHLTGNFVLHPFHSERPISFRIIHRKSYMWKLSLQFPRPINFTSHIPNEQVRYNKAFVIKATFNCIDDLFNVWVFKCKVFAWKSDVYTFSNQHEKPTKRSALCTSTHNYRFGEGLHHSREISKHKLHSLSIAAENKDNRSGTTKS